MRSRSLLFSILLVSAAEAKTYIIHLNSPGTFKKISEQLSSALKASGKKDLFGMKVQDLPKVLGTEARALEALKHLNMIIIEGSEEDLKKISAEKDVSFIEADQTFALPPPLPITTELRAPGDGIANGERPWGIDAVRAPQAWELGSRGEGVRVLVLDTGIDRDHVDIRNRFEEGRNFVLRRPQPTPIPRGGNSFLEGGMDMAEPFTEVPYDYFDLNGHGTHCAGTILGDENNEGVVGVAPRARLLAGRICGKFGCTLTGIVNGINYAIERNVNVVSMSLGGPMSARAQEEAVLQAERSDILIVAASGNGGDEAANNNRISFPAGYSSVLAVGAVDSQSQRASFSQWSPELDIVAPGVEVKSSVPTGSGRSSVVRVPLETGLSEIPSTSFVGAPSSEQSIQGELINCGLGKVADFNGLNLQGRIALMGRGEISFAEKVQNAIRAGARAAVIYNNTAGLMSGALTDDGTEVAISVVLIEQSQGERLANELRAGRAQNLELHIYRTNYALFSGTSMATPHAAGVAALVRGANPQKTAAEVREILKQSSQRLENPADRNEFGAGLVNSEAAVRNALNL